MFVSYRMHQIGTNFAGKNRAKSCNVQCDKERKGKYQNCYLVLVGSFGSF